MKEILKAVNAQLKLINEDLDWHKRELKEYKANFLKSKKTIDDLLQEKDVLMKEIERLKSSK